MTVRDIPRCPRCGARLPEPGPCPGCLLALGLESPGSDELRLAPGAWLGPYQILAAAGVGGMGEVYRARDSRLERDVAIKILPAALADDPIALDRFRREARSVAALSHANIVALHDLAEDGDVLFAVMEFLEGETLRSVLVRGCLPWRRAARLATEIARGLAAAHDRGIVHRDLKPENVFVTATGDVKILDFGLAKDVGLPAAQDLARSPVASARSSGFAGTLGYMSPEQVRSEPAARASDVFSFGALLYEMLAGEAAFRADSVEQAMAASLDHEPESLSAIAPATPAELTAIVRRCLEKSPEARYATARDVVLDLESVAAQSGSGPVPAAPVLRLAVLPFENLGPPADDYFADGIADAVRGKLTLLPSLEVIARASSTPFKNSQPALDEVARTLGARYLLVGTVRWQKRAGATSRVEVTPELVEVGPGPPASRWQASFDAELTEVFAVQSDIATRVAAALGVALGAGEAKRLGERPTLDVHAYDAFLRGEEASNGLAATDPNSLRRALVYYERAVALDPRFAQAWAQLARAGALLHFHGVPTAAHAERGRESVERTVALAADRPEADLAQGDEKRWVAKDPAAALEHYRRGRLLAPAHAELLAGMALAEQGLGQWAAAADHLRLAERRDPRSISSKRRLGFGYLCLRRYGEARAALDEGLALGPANLALIAYKVMTHVAEGDLDGARQVLLAVPPELDPSTLVAYLALYDLVWILDSGERLLLSRLTPSAFDGDRAVWAICLAQEGLLRGDGAAVTRYGELAREAVAGDPRFAADEPRRKILLALALAFLGRAAEAVRTGEHAVEILPISRDAYTGAYLTQQLARVYLLLGRTEEALDRLATLLAIPHHLSAGWLQIDPTYDSLRSLPRFQRLLGQAT
jgi:serine/threonine protein kinase/tetratricopeptide (TPR) repeat protein